MHTAASATPLVMPNPCYHVQAFPEFIMQGKHFAHSVDKKIFSDEEVTSLDSMYGRTSKVQSMDDFMSKVRAK